ncbi:hypothetical protein V7124_03990 [Neobacillus niacini]|uniref:hypothetical protein n=1 Tax=Neobacillus niacini TaxID=86668 RepID=UPI002FFF973D
MSKGLKMAFKLKNKKQKKYIYSILVGLSVLTTGLFFYILLLPEETTETNTENNIIQETVFSFKADVEPFVLHPEGGIINVENGSFTKVTNDLIVHINSNIISDKPIKVKGSKEVGLNLIAADLWHKQMILGKEDSFELEGTSINLMDEDYPINLKQLVSLMNEVEESINIIPANYIFEIMPMITGKVIYNDKEIPIDHNAHTNIEYSKVQITVGNETSFKTTTPILSKSPKQLVFYFFGMEVSLFLVKVASVVIYLVLLAAGLKFIHQFKANDPIISSEKEKIDKKYKARMVTVLQSGITTIDSNKRAVVDSFSSLLKISDEKDALIFTFEDSDRGIKVYYVIDEGYLFIYQTSISNPYAGRGYSHA